MSRRHWSVLFVSPRWAPQAAGGAEELSRLLAERFARRGHRVEAVATCADDPHTWKNTLPPGEEVVNGVAVRRFPVNKGRLSGDFLNLQRRIDCGQRLTREEEERWIGGSAVSDGLNVYLRAEHGRFDALVFVPYLFGVTYFGSLVCPRKSLLIPCLHDESFAHLAIYRDMFSRFRGFLFNSRPEMELAQRLYGIAPERSFLVSMGFEEPEGLDADRFRSRRNLREPFLLYAGRREEGKNTPLLIEYFRLWKRRTGGDMKLVLIGTGEVQLRSGQSEGIVDLGFLSRREKMDAMAASLAFCQPSVNESFSIVIMESWLAGRPVLVHAGCAVTLDHVEQSNGGLWFEDYLTFEECLTWFLDHPAGAAAMARNGKAYVLERYSWEAVLERFEDALHRSVGADGDA